MRFSSLRQIVRLPCASGTFWLSLICANVAFGQKANQQVCAMLSPGLETFSVALGLTQQVTAMHNLSTNRSSSTSSRVQLTDLLNAASEVGKSTADVPWEVGEADLITRVFQNRQTENNGQSTDFFKFSALLIGGVGAGVGGSLHLVNNASVFHAGTVVGIAGGVSGAAINPVDLALQKKHKPSLADLLQSTPHVRSYIEAVQKQCPQISYEAMEKKPSLFSTLLVRMSDQNHSLQMEARSIVDRVNSAHGMAIQK